MPTFADLGPPDFLLRAIEAKGFVTPTAIQLQAIPLVASGADVLAEARTGSGKTAAFAIPIIQRLSASTADSSVVRSLVITPTRELAIQVAASFKALGRFAPVPTRVLAVIGGEPIEAQIAALSAGIDVVVATPGRLLDLLARGEIDLGQVQILVLDEADKLLNAGFSDELNALLPSLPTERQTLLFSATLPQSVVALSLRLTRDAVTVRIDETPSVGIVQRVFQVDRDRRRALLQHLVTAESWGRTLVFVATQKAADNLSSKLRVAGFTSAALHGGLDQPQRNHVLSRFKGGGSALLVATDLAARGIDIPQLDVVVNFDLPRSPDDYVHRIGRTGRAGEAGVAVSFVDHDTEAHLRLIEKRCQLRLDRLQREGFELTGPAPERVRGAAPVKGKRMSKKDKLRAKE